MTAVDRRFVTVVAAVAKNRAIGLRGEMPWHLPDELRHFKRITLGKPVLMGRKTFEAIGRPLPGRQNLVISRHSEYRAEGVATANSLEEAMALAAPGEVMVIGGGELYRLALPIAGRMFLTVVDCEPEADTWFPRWREGDWELVGSVPHAVDERHDWSFQMQEWLRVAPASS